MLNRGPLALWSLDAHDEAWPAALAALGVLAALPPEACRAALGGAPLPGADDAPAGIADLPPGATALAAPDDAGIAAAMQPPPLDADTLCEALGAAWHQAEQAAQRGRQQPALNWQLPDIDASGEVSLRVAMPQALAAAGLPRRASHWPAPDAALLARAWQRWLDHRHAQQGPRLRVRPRSRQPLSDTEPTLDLAPVLAQAGTAGVFVDDEAFASDGRNAWQWPFTLATLPGQPLAEAFASRQQRLPVPWPFRLATASRDTPHVEVLVIDAPAAQALAQWLGSGLRLRACLVVVAGLGDDTPAQALPLLHALAARVGAEGIAAMAPRQPGPDGAAAWTDALCATGEALAHDLPLDMALAQGLGPGLLLMGRDLAQLSSLSRQLVSLGQRIEALPADTELPLSIPAATHLRVPSPLLRPIRRNIPGFPRNEGILARGAGGLGGEGGGGGGGPALPDLTRSFSFALPPLPTATHAVKAGALRRAIREALPDLAFAGESHEASATAELSRRLRRHQAAKAAEEKRYVHQSSWSRRAGRLRRMPHGYLLGLPVMLRVDIGPDRSATDRHDVHADVVFPDALLPRNVERHELQLVLYEPRQMDVPLRATIDLPAQGRSNTGQFVFTPRAEGAFAARLSVLHRGRVLQTLTLNSWVAADERALTAREENDERITLTEEAWVRQDWSRLDKRRRFDLALVFNHDAQDQPRATGIAERCAWATDLSAMHKPMQQINDAISGVATRVLDHADGLDQGQNPALLVALARAGVRLRAALYGDQLALNQAGGLDVGSDAVQSIQVVTLRADEVVPIEFIYDFDTPDDDATVCPQHRQALAEGRCPAGCARQAAPEAHVCPMGFWGLKKEIERHQFNQKVKAPAGYPLVVQSEPAGERAHLELARGLIVGHSAQVERPAVAELAERLGTLLQHPVTVVDDWKAWRAAVGKDRPGLLLAFPHNEVSSDDARLEIGGKLLDTLGLKPDYVRSPEGPQQPVVMLLGCDVAGTAEEYANHIGWFRRAGAAVVVGTVATVFGEHAVKVGQAITTALLAPSDQPRRIAEVIRDAKRQALLDSLPMALCVVAFGDADWQL